ncbi:L-rhamnose/proton symporter RhaT [Rubritalea marina]|uniref:L-rhamnose/proton symporter RhaT n=1 Tax=Rubritalea marina TaxID=361055 RepID=UPI00037D4DA4|nr:L-rhamnose/proton symporter RhaT [Rubritalea marina]
MESNIVFGVGLHAIGGIAASTCFVPQKFTSKWSYQTSWMIIFTVAWFIAPILTAALTVPNLWQVITEVDQKVLTQTTLLGGIYGFGGMAFALAIRHIGFSLTYSIAIGISAVLGTVIPPLLAGTLMETFSQAGGNILVAGFLISIIGICLCGYAGALKEKELSGSGSDFDLKKGLSLVLIAGVLSAVFGISLSVGAPIDAVAADHGAGSFSSNATYIFAMGGSFLVNLIWWSVAHTRQQTWSEFKKIPSSDSGRGKLLLPYYGLAILAGILWYVQFFFYGMGHVHMGDAKFISWGIHMAMLIFFSFGIGLILKEWKGLSLKTITVLIVGLCILVTSFACITYGGLVAQQAAEASGKPVEVPSH